jgi:hypothetical protein
MTIEIIALVGFAFIATSLIAEVLGRRRDVLYGAYIEGREVQRSLVVAMFEHAIIELQQSIARLVWKARNISCFASAIIG